MPLPVATQLRYWGLAAAVAVVLLWLLGNALLPFILGAGLAYLLNPTVERLVRLGLGRVLATTLIAILFAAGAALVVVFLVPVLINQTLAFLKEAPAFLTALIEALQREFPSRYGQEGPVDRALTGMVAWLQERGGDVAGTVYTSAVSVVSVLVMIVIVPVVAFYLLVDWPRLVRRMDGLLPRQHAPTVRRLVLEMDTAIGAFLRGMGAICLTMAIYYGLALSAVGLQFGMVVGVLAGFLTFIPYLGAITGGVLAIGLALYQFWGEWFSVALVAGVFFAGQAIESYAITPRVVGRSVGLHPVWILVALSVFGALFGLVGFVIAVPVAAALAVLVRYAVGLYEQSALYAGPLIPPTHSKLLHDPSDPGT
jgi:predicted PurR-regulated permease PerM